ncbi:hypothetical protein ACJBYY_06230, partial [Streptococcus suis]
KDLVLFSTELNPFNNIFCLTFWGQYNIKESLFNKKYFDQEFDWILYDSKISLHDFYDLHDFIDARDTEVKSIIVGEYSENLYHSCIGKNELKKAEAKNER